MNRKELEQLEKKSLESLRLDNKLKDTVIQQYLNEMNKKIKSIVKKNQVVILVMETS